MNSNHTILIKPYESDGVCFQEYLHWFAQAYPNQLHLIQLDNGRLHTWSELDLPDNVILIFQLPACG